MRISDWSSDVCSSDLHTFRMLRDRAYQQMVEANPVEKGKVDNRAASLENLYNLAAGKTEPVANPGVAQFFDGLRSLMVASRLGSAVITALSDEGTLRLAADTPAERRRRPRPDPESQGARTGLG